ncbi:hypothetical protein PHYSODRAFT_492978, partial [Phytophthora sojae]
LFLGLIDLALTNAYIVHRQVQAANGKRAMSHFQFLAELHAQLLNVQPDDFTRNTRDTLYTPTIPTRPSTAHEHLPEETQYFTKEIGDPRRKRKHRACKVCSCIAGSTDKRGKTPSGSVERAPWASQASNVYLCQHYRRQSGGIKKSCFSIWHEDWENGNEIPLEYSKRLQFRLPSQARRTRAQT